jgi:hypothetical protein
MRRELFFLKSNQQLQNLNEMKDSVSFSTTMKASLFAAITAAVLNTIVFFALSGMNVISSEYVVNDLNKPVTISHVIPASIFPLLMAGILYWLLDRYTEKAFATFTILAVILLLASVVNPFLLINDIPLRMAMGLYVMHLVNFGAVVFFLRRLSLEKVA